MQEHDHDDDDYRGSAVVFTENDEVAVEVILRGRFEPVDGRFHWYGRVAACDRIEQLTGGKKTMVVLRTLEGQAAAALADPDPWGRYRISGVGRPPFHIEVDLAEDASSPFPAKS